MKILLFIPFLFMCSMVIGQSSKIIGTPYRLSKIKVAQYDFPKQMTWYDAKKACANLGNGWRLPTLYELRLLFSERVAIGGFGGYGYWSSSQDSNDDAWTVSFFFGHLNSVNKGNDLGRVRAVRSL